MKREDSYLLMSIQEFELWLRQIMPVRIINHIQQHHTYIPSYSNFNGSNHLELQNSIRNFDRGKDEMTAEQKGTIIRMTTSFCIHFNLVLNTDSIVYHHWFDLDTGNRNNGTGNNKTCPGTNFFGGNSPEDCRTKFIPLHGETLSALQPESPKL